MEIELNKIYCGDALEVLKQMPGEIVNCVVTSPPYWGLRDYGTAKWEGGDPECDHFITKLSSNKSTLHEAPEKKKMETGIPYKKICGKCGAKRIDDQLGLEKTPEEYVQKLVEIFREVKRVLRKDGTVWLNLGDSYASGKGTCYNPGGNTSSFNVHLKAANVHPLDKGNKKTLEKSGLKPKDLVGIPWMVAFALRADGWYLRQDLIWYKKNPMPESVTDRCTKAHEYIFLLSKSGKYYFDAEAIKTETKNISNEQITPSGWETGRGAHGSFHKNGREKGYKGYKHRGRGDKKLTGHSGNFDAEGKLIGDGKANKRSVWEVPTKGYSEAHYATFPPKLIEDCIKAGCPERVCVKCGNPEISIIKKTLVPTKKAARRNIIDERDLIADKNDQGSNRQKDGHIPGWCNHTEIIRQEPTCNCNQNFVPGVVLDPFMGAGTTAIVTRKQNKNYIGIELNEKNIEMSNRRIDKELGMWK